MKLCTLEQEIKSNFSETSEVRIGIDNKYGECLISSITIKELFSNYYYNDLLGKKVKDVFNTSDNKDYQFVFVINSKR